MFLPRNINSKILFLQITTVTTTSIAPSAVLSLIVSLHLLLLLSTSCSDASPIGGGLQRRRSHHVQADVFEVDASRDAEDDEDQDDESSSPGLAGRLSEEFVRRWRSRRRRLMRRARRKMPLTSFRL